jgi:secreted trypsin-like serine protease
VLQFVLTAAHCLGTFNSFEIGAFCYNKYGIPNGNCGQVRGDGSFQKGIFIMHLLVFHYLKEAFDSLVLCMYSPFMIQASEVIDATKNIAHPGYNYFTADNDFALVKLERAAQATPIAMDSNELSGSYTTAKKLWPVGFGNTRTSGTYFPQKLNHVSVSYVPNDTCSSAYGAGTITSNMMCAADSYADSCQGDSGTMMMICMPIVSLVF